MAITIHFTGFNFTDRPLSREEFIALKGCTASEFDSFVAARLEEARVQCWKEFRPMIKVVTWLFGVSLFLVLVFPSVDIVVAFAAFGFLSCFGVLMSLLFSFKSYRIYMERLTTHTTNHRECIKDCPDYEDYRSKYL